jgi:hypothetical protein
VSLQPRRIWEEFDPKKGWTTLRTVAGDRELIEAVAAEMSAGIQCAVNFWMKQIEDALHDPRLTTLGRFHAVQDIVKRYTAAEEAETSRDRYIA